MGPTTLQRGFSLLELLTSVMLGALLVIAATQLVLAVGSSFRLQQNLGAMQENARFAFETVGREIEAAGYHPEPWTSSISMPALGEGTADSTTRHNDHVSVQYWTDKNCHENTNTIEDEHGLARIFLRESTFSVNSSGGLAMNCRYGPDQGQLVTQINNLGLIENVDSFQALFAEDSDADGDADRWVTAGQWTDSSAIRAVRLGMLLASAEPVKAPGNGHEQVLGETLVTGNDGKLRKVFETTYTIKGKRQ